MNHLLQLACANAAFHKLLPFRSENGSSVQSIVVAGFARSNHAHAKAGIMASRNHWPASKIGGLPTPIDGAAVSCKCRVGVRTSRGSVIDACVVLGLTALHDVSVVSLSQGLDRSHHARHPCRPSAPANRSRAGIQNKLILRQRRYRAGRASRNDQTGRSHSQNSHEAPRLCNPMGLRITHYGFRRKRQNAAPSQCHGSVCKGSLPYPLADIKLGANLAAFDEARRRP